MIRSGLLFLIFLLALLNWIGSSIAAKSAMHETTAAVAGLSALVALAASLICDALRESTQAAAKHAEAARALLLEMKTCAERRCELLDRQTEAFAAAQRDLALQVEAMLRHQVHTNELLRWLGELKSTSQP